MRRDAGGSGAECRADFWANFWGTAELRFAWLAMALCALAITIIGLATPAHALDPIAVEPDTERIEITNRGIFFDNRGDSLQVETAASADGVVGRMSVRAQTNGTNPNWIVFALTNPSDKFIERWLTADRYRIVGSGIVWPDLDASRIAAVTPSIGFLPERIASERADVFRITLEPGQTITFVAELSTERFARVFLWEPLAYELKVRERQLFNGIMLGLTGLLAVFLTVIFAANHKAIFPTAALVAWCVLCYLCIDFGFFHKLFSLKPEDNAVYRAAGEASMAASLVIFLHTFLRLGFSHGILRMLLAVWMLAQLALVAVAVVDPRLASTFARLSFVLIGAVGAVLTLFLAVRGQDRALSLIPTWLLFLVWIFATAMTLTGRLAGDVVVAGLVAGLVLIVVLIGFTVTQFAFRSLEPVYGAAPNEQQLRSLAVDGAGAATWEWNARRDEVKVSPVVEAMLGLNVGELSCKVEDFVGHIHPADRERFRLTLWSVQERSAGKLNLDFRLRHSDNTYRWFELQAASVETVERRNLRCVGLLREVTETKRAQERLLQDAVNCSLTGLPNRELFLDRLSVVMKRANGEGGERPTVIFIDIDKFKSVNATYGIVVGDTLLLTLARRLQRHLGEHDTLSRMGGDQFAVLLHGQEDPRELAGLAERIRRSLRSPITIAGQDITLTGSLGMAVYDGAQETHHDLLKEAELAMYRAKRSGADRIEIFRPEMRGQPDDRIQIENDLRRAIERDEITVMYQPIVYLPTEELAGFEALVRWEHPTKGMLNPASFIPVAEETDLIVKLGSHVLMKSVETAAVWQTELPRGEGEGPLFVSVNISSRQLMQQDLIQEVRHIMGRSIIPRGTLRLELTESLIMENPEKAVELLEQLQGAGAEIAIDDFGTGYSSLAYLQRLPFDTLKIDKMLVQSSSEGESSGAAIVRSVVALAHELGKKVVAEGVEQPDDVGFLRSINCEYAQGYYYGEPMPQENVLELLRIIRKSERRLEARGFFRTKPKTKKTKKPARPAATPGVGDATQPSAPMAADGVANGAFNGTGQPADKPIPNAPQPAENGASGDHPPAQRPKPHPVGERRDVPRTVTALPNSTVRPLNRPAGSSQPNTAPPSRPSPSQGPMPAAASRPQGAPPVNGKGAAANGQAGGPGSAAGSRPAAPPAPQQHPQGQQPPVPPPSTSRTAPPPANGAGPKRAAPANIAPHSASPPPQQQRMQPSAPQPMERNASDPPRTQPPADQKRPAAGAQPPPPPQAGPPPAQPTAGPTLSAKGVEGLSLSTLQPQSKLPNSGQSAGSRTPEPPGTGQHQANGGPPPIRPAAAAAHGGNGGPPKPPRRRPPVDLPDLSKLPPGIAASLAKLAGEGGGPRPRRSGDAGPAGAPRPVGGGGGHSGGPAAPVPDEEGPLARGAAEVTGVRPRRRS